MPIYRFYCEDPLLAAKEVILEGQEFHHLVRVTRKGMGEVIELVNGQGHLAQGRIQALKKTYALIQIQSISQTEIPHCKIVLAQAIPRLNRLDFILEKGTELGLTELWLFPGKYSERKKISMHQMQRMRTISIAAMKQSGRLYLPKITMKPPLEQWETFVYPSYFGDISANAPPFFQVLKQQSSQESTLFFIGPESGFSDKETSVLNTLGAQGVRLHSNTLRTDTAALAALTLISHFHLTHIS